MSENHPVDAKEARAVTERYKGYFKHILKVTLSKPRPAKLRAVCACVGDYADNVLPGLLMSREEARRRAEKYEDGDGAI